jgi:dihydroxyacetone kinase
VCVETDGCVPTRAGGRVVLLVNNLGSTTSLELGVAAKECVRALSEAQVGVGAPPPRSALGRFVGVESDCC